MQVHLQGALSNNALFQRNSGNEGIDRLKAAVNRSGGDNRRDRAVISPQGKMLQRIDELSKQKEAIIARKGELVSKTMENGGDMKNIETQLKTYQKQMEDIDEQIEQVTSEMMKQSVDPEKEKKTKKSDENKTEEQLQVEKLNQIAGAAVQVERAEAVAAIQDRVEGAARVEDAEVKTGELEVIALEDKTAGGTGVNVAEMVKNAEQVLEGKRELSSELHSLALDMSISQGAVLKAATDALEDATGEDRAHAKPEGALPEVGSAEVSEETQVPAEEADESFAMERTTE